MCHHVETVITSVYHFDSDSTDVWVTQQVDESQSEIIGCLLGAPAAITKMLSKAISEVAFPTH
jgi:hypothetical protein